MIRGAPCKRGATVGRPDLCAHQPGGAPSGLFASQELIRYQPGEFIMKRPTLLQGLVILAAIGLLLRLILSLVTA